MNKYHFYLKIRIDVETELSKFDAMADISSEIDYNIYSTDQVKVVDMELSDVSENYRG